MSHAYSLDLRQRIVDAISEGQSRRAAAATFKVSPATAVRFKQRLDRTGSVDPSRRGRPGGSGKLGLCRDMSSLLRWKRSRISPCLTWRRGWRSITP